MDGRTEIVGAEKVQLVPHQKGKPIHRKEFALRIREYYGTRYPLGQQQYLQDWINGNDPVQLGLVFDWILKNFTPTAQNPLPGIVHLEEGKKGTADQLKSAREENKKKYLIDERGLSTDDQQLVEIEFMEFQEVCKKLEAKKAFGSLRY